MATSSEVDAVQMKNAEKRKNAALARADEACAVVNLSWFRARGDYCTTRLRVATGRGAGRR